MKIISLLIFVSFAALGQQMTLMPANGSPQKDLRKFPRWQEEAIIIDIIHADHCDSIKAVQAKLIENLNEMIYVQGGRLIKLTDVDSLKSLQLQSFKTTVSNQDTLVRYWKRQDIKHKRQRNLVVAVVVVLEVLKIISGHP